MKKTLTLAIFAFVAACGPLNEGRSGPEMFNLVRSELTGKTVEQPAAPIPAEVANAGPGEVLLVTLRARGAVAPMLRVGENAGNTTWISPGKVSMTFRDDILISTRGLGDDLMGADIPGLRAALNARSGTTTRKQSYLNSLDQIRISELSCTVASAGIEDVATTKGPRSLTKVTESCQGPRLVFENVYWMDGTRIVKSLQAISPTQGFIEAELL